MSTLATLAAEIRALYGKSPRIVRDANGWKAEIPGRIAAYGDTREGALQGLLEAPADEEPRCCSICDAPGHGYPGGGPCPLEDRGEPIDEREAAAIAREEAEMARVNGYDRCSCCCG
jgi:hypothetical protein